MDDLINMCGNNLTYIQYLIHHLKFGGGPDDGGNIRTVSELAQLTEGIVQVLVSRQVSNRGLGQTFQAESAKGLTAAAERFAYANQSVAA